MLNINKELSGVKVGSATVFGGLAVFPLIRKKGPNRDYLTLTEAFHKGGVEIGEVSEGGSVPELKFTNKLDQDVFAADGETLLGAKQNRVLNTSIYVNAKSEIRVPVSCVEQGRWRYQGRNFRASELSEFINSRAAKMESVAQCLKATGTDRYSDQGAVWREVAAKQRDFGAYSPTGSMEEVYEARRPRLNQYVEKFRVEPGQAGLAAVIRGRVVGLELFEETGVYRQYAPRLVRAYASEVLGRDELVTSVPDRSIVKRLLTKAIDASYDAFPAVGDGTEIRFSMNGLNGSALVAKKKLLHMVLLSSNDKR